MTRKRRIVSVRGAAVAVLLKNALIMRVNRTREPGNQPIQHPESQQTQVVRESASQPDRRSDSSTQLLVTGRGFGQRQRSHRHNTSGALHILTINNNR